MVRFRTWEHEDELYPSLPVQFRRERGHSGPPMRVWKRLNTPPDPDLGARWVVVLWHPGQDGTPLVCWERELRMSDVPHDPPELPAWAIVEESDVS